ncbi:tandem five-TM protein [Staphylococcus aureus]|nr:tandem five-TM protein [Staphylococcus aureus]CAC8066434.1 tandem five-TM protein [Staphylococcus aureus]CAC8160447.1 tandem five-TM protein [Staphylococcus aureus]CAC8321769.1 tandem five-TM protein [Staphylococcus aureus]CAC8881341.1 tandem five-TM protein [Staphylococcus aureus]
MLCESRQIYKNPKYRVIRYNNEYFMVDLVSTWITYFFPMINWFCPKNTQKLAKMNFKG